MDYGFATRAIHAGQEPDPETGSVIVPIYQTSTYAQSEVGVHKGYEYSRTDNPTRTALHACLAALEGGTYALAFASGLGATTTLMLMLKAGDHVIVGDDVYGGTYRLFQRVMTEFGLVFDFVDMANPDEVRAALRPETRMVWLETPTNPLVKLADIRAISALARQHGALTVVDNTFASPYGQQPLALGADIVLHSTTKYIGGHSDVVGGAIITSHEQAYERLKFLQNAAGAVPGAFDSWLVLRGVKTLAVRMREHERNAFEVARFLEQHPAVERVIYPGLPSHPQYELARQQMQCFGGMISLILCGGEAAGREMVRRTKLFTLAESLGGVESLIEMPAAMTHASVTGSKLEVPAGLVRLSVGIEDVADLLTDLKQALADAPTRAVGQEALVANHSEA
ncbi:MAG: cystathionine gamma-synthase [Chloroflexota bacterium]|nr:cystathionine gamma-synthase [Chloroflexota bacterium]